MKLKAKQRNALPSKDFAGPNRSFPIPDKGHARAALAEIGHAPPSARPKIHAMAERELHGGKKSIVPRGEHHKANHREPRTHKEFHQLGNSASGSAQGSSQDNANMQGAQGIETE